MTKEEVKELFMSLGYAYERDEEYHRDYYTTKYNDTKVEIFVDYYTLRVLWWYEPRMRVGKNYRMSQMNEPLGEHFIEDAISDLKKEYGIK